MVKKESYFCTSKRELSIRDLRYLSQNIGCSVSFAGRVGQNRWDYFLNTMGTLSKEDFAFIREKGLVVLLTAQQSKNLSHSLDISQFTDSINMQAPNA